MTETQEAISTAGIRRFEFSDFPALADLGRPFYAESGLPGIFLAHCFIDSWTKLLESGIGEIWLLSKAGKVCGAIGFIAVPDLNDGEMVASELFWFMSADARGHGMTLLDKFESRAKELGCQRMLMVHLSSLRGETLTRLYERRGYKLLESHFIKEIN